MTTESKLVPVALLKDIESTWREASAFSNTANTVIERGLPELRALLAAPVTRQYYYRKDGCVAFNSTDPDCICWYDEGTGPLFNNPMTTVLPSSWRDKPQSELDALRKDLGAIVENRNALKDRLTAAEQRNAVLHDLLLRTLAYYTESCFPEDLLIEVKIALGMIKPTESEASDAERKEDDRWLQMKDDAERADYFDESGASE